jgi:hypothetical protein
MEAAPSLTAIDVRTVFITNKRVIFSGRATSTRIRSHKTHRVLGL